MFRLIVFIVLMLVEGDAGAAPTYESSSQHCFETNLFNRETHEDLWRSALRRCLREEQMFRLKLEALLKDSKNKRFEERCQRHRSYEKQFACVEHYRTDFEKTEARAAFIMRLPATNEAIPQVDVEGTCRRRSKNEGQDAYRECMAKQQAAYDYLKPLWPRMPKDNLLKCRWMLFELPNRSKQINPDYHFVKSCLEREIDALMQQKDIRSVPFRY